MQYIPSSEVKGKGVHYEGIDHRIPWVIADGTMDTLRERYALGTKKDILDIGCGNGQTLEYFEKSAHTLAGIDLNDYLTIPHKEKVAFSVVDLNFENLPYEDGSKDMVFALQVIEHLENPFLVMREAHRVLREGGLFIFSVPNAFTLSSKKRYLFTNNVRRWNKKNDHLLFLTDDVFYKTYGAYFDILSAHYQKGLVPMLGRLYRLLGIKATEANTKILPRSRAFGDSVCSVLRKKESV
jgi:SAM-dependent methyltransferase